MPRILAQAFVLIALTACGGHQLAPLEPTAADRARKHREQTIRGLALDSCSAWRLAAFEGRRGHPLLEYRYMTWALTLAREYRSLHTKTPLAEAMAGVCWI